MLRTPFATAIRIRRSRQGLQEGPACVYSAGFISLPLTWSVDARQLTEFLCEDYGAKSKLRSALLSASPDRCEKSVIDFFWLLVWHYLRLIMLPGFGTAARS